MLLKDFPVSSHNIKVSPGFMAFKMLSVSFFFCFSGSLIPAAAINSIERRCGPVILCRYLLHRASMLASLWFSIAIMAITWRELRRWSEENQVQQWNKMHSVRIQNIQNFIQSRGEHNFSATVQRAAFGSIIACNWLGFSASCCSNAIAVHFSISG